MNKRATQHSLLILGGSSPYTLMLIKALVESGLVSRFHQIILHGRNEARLNFITAVAHRLVCEAGFHCDIIPESEIQRCTACSIDIVFNQMRFGGLAKRDLDERLAIECGLPADETLGIVGASNALRAINGLAGYAEVFLAFRQQPLWVNFTNPCSIVTQYLRRRLATEVIGICDYPQVFKRKIAAALGAPPDSIDIRYFGLNHLAFVYHVSVDGRSVLHTLLDPTNGFDLAISAQRGLDFLVVPTWNFVFDPASIWARQRNQSNRASCLLEIESEFNELSSRGPSAARQCFSVLDRRRCEWYELAVAPLLAMCLEETPGEAIVNTPLDDVFGLGISDTVVETNALVNSSGARALAIPPHVRNSTLFDYCRNAKRSEDGLLRGILQRDFDTIVEACSQNPMMTGRDHIVRYLTTLRAMDPDMEGVWGE